MRVQQLMPFFVMAVLFSTPAIAQVPVTSDMLKGPQVQTGGSGIAFISGGFGQPERQDVLAKGAGFSLRLEFTQGGEPYVSNVQVQITGPGGSLDVANAGPLLLVDLPQGAYQVTGTLEGRSVSTKITTGGNQQRVVLRF